MGVFWVVQNGISGVDLTGEESLVIGGREFNTGIVAVGFDTNQLGGTSVVSNPLIPGGRARHPDVMHDRWALGPSTPIPTLCQFGTSPLSFTGLPNPRPRQREQDHRNPDYGFLSTVPLAAFGAPTATSTS